MLLTSCAAISSSVLALAFSILGSYLTFRLFTQLSHNFKPSNLYDRVVLKKVSYLGASMIFSSICLLYSSTYFTRDINSGESHFFSQKIVYEECSSSKEIPFNAQESDDEEEGDEEIASLLLPSCFLKS